MSDVLNYIPDDGYTEQAYIAPNGRLHGEFHFEYRPMLLEERQRIFASKASYDALSRKIAAEVARKIVSWSLLDSNGSLVPVTATNLLKLKPTLEDRVTAIVMGTESSDIDPLWPDATKNEVAEEQYESALSGESKEETALGN